MNGRISFDNVRIGDGLSVNKITFQGGQLFIKDLETPDLKLIDINSQSSCQINVTRTNLSKLTIRNISIQSLSPFNVNFNTLDSLVMRKLSGVLMNVYSCTIKSRFTLGNIDINSEKFSIFDNEIFSNVIFEIKNISGLRERGNSSGLELKNILLPEYTSKIEKITGEGIGALIEFKYCKLNYVYFNNCKMDVISLYTSIFEKAIFLDNDWNNGSSSNQEYQLHEHLNYSATKKGISTREIESMYAQLRSSFDAQRKYQEAGEFYYHENELKRNRLWHEGNNITSFIFFLNKYILGYNQRPIRSLKAFIIGIFIFCLVILYKGLNVSETIINYETIICSSLFEITSQIWKVFIFSLVNIVPTILLGSDFQKSVTIVGSDIGNLTLSLTYSLYSILTFSSLVISLKRVFKRF
ncbi:MAG: hypothetical protein RID18_11430 [Cytophagales bacterium]